MEVILDSGVELGKQDLIFDLLILLHVLAVFSLLHHSAYDLLHFLLDDWHVFLGEQVGDLPDSQDGIDILHKALLANLIVREHEYCRAIILECAFLRPLLDLLSELFQLESLGDGHLAEVVLSDMSRQLGERVPSRTALAH